MEHLLRNRLRSLSGLERVVYGLVGLIGVIAVLLLAFGDQDAAVTPRRPAAPVAPPSADAPPQPVARCSETRIPAMPPEPVTCRTAAATLTIAAQQSPVLLGTTEARLLAAYAGGTTLVLRARVRNVTEAEQGVLAGGQEMYVNLDGRRLDPRPLGEVRVAPGTAVTVPLRFALTGNAGERLRRSGGRGELGVRPWTDGGTPDDGNAVVGVIRFRATLPGDRGTAG